MPCNCGANRYIQSSEAYAHADAIANFVTVPVYSAYLGQVQLSGIDLGRGNIALRSVVRGIHVNTIDAVLSGLQVLTTNYQLSYLMRLPVTVINVNECKRHYDIIHSDVDQETRHLSLIHNICVDIHFNTCGYVNFLQEQIGVNNIIASNVLVSIHNVAKYDNAFFSGSYMVYGNGDSLFYPLGAIDTTGHELSHGLVQLFAGLVYEGHAGALNESFADVGGVSFEFFMYNRNQLEGKSDWTLGEDMGKRIKYLRNMQDPNDAEMPQPKFFRGIYWADPNSSVDYGNVHRNSGVANFCFYNFAQKVGVIAALSVWLECLKQLKPRASYLDFRDVIKPLGAVDLDIVGLGPSAVSDWQ